MRSRIGIPWSWKKGTEERVARRRGYLLGPNTIAAPLAGRGPLLVDPVGNHNLAGAVPRPIYSSSVDPESYDASMLFEVLPVPHLTLGSLHSMTS